MQYGTAGLADFAGADFLQTFGAAVVPDIPNSTLAHQRLHSGVEIGICGLDINGAAFSAHNNGARICYTVNCLESRFLGAVCHRGVNLEPRERAALLAGIPLDRVPPELGGAMLQITAWFFLVEFAVLRFLVQNPNRVLGVFTLLMWSSMFGALWIVKRIVRKLD